MTKKDYELIASVIKLGKELPIEIRKCGHSNYKDNYVITHDELLAQEMATALASKNPRFNKEKFLLACGVEVDNDNYGKANPSSDEYKQAVKMGY